MSQQEGPKPPHSGDPIDDVDFAAAQRIYRLISTDDGSAPQRRRGRPLPTRERWTPARRRRFLRAAFVGNVEVPFVLVVVVVSIFGLGVIVGHAYFNRVEADRIRHEAERASVEQFMRDLAVVRTNAHDNQQFLEFVERLVVELEEVRATYDEQTPGESAPVD